MATYIINSCSLGQVITDTAGTLTIDLHTASSGKVGMITGSDGRYSNWVYLYLPNKNVTFTFTTDLGPNGVESNMETYLGEGNSAGAVPVLSFYLGAGELSGGVGTIKRYAAGTAKAYVIARDSNNFYHRPLYSFDGYNAYQISGAYTDPTTNAWFGTVYNRTGSLFSSAPYSPLMSGFVGSLATASLNQYIPPAAGVNVFTTTLNLTGNSNAPGAVAPGTLPYYHDTPAGYVMISIWSPTITTYYRDYSGFTITWSTTENTASIPYDRYSAGPKGGGRRYAYDLGKIYRIYNNDFHTYFDRDNNLNSYVSFNPKEFLKDKSVFPKIYDDEDFSAYIDKLLKFDFYLQDKQSKLFKIDSVEKTDLFSDQGVYTFYLKHNVKKLNGDYLIRCIVSYADGFNDYINNAIINDKGAEIFNLSEYQLKIRLKEIKKILDEKLTSNFMVINPSKTYEFSSNYIKIENKNINVSNLREIYSREITYKSYVDYITKAEEQKRSTYDGTVPIVDYYIDSNIKKLDYNFAENTGSLQEYEDLCLGLVQSRTYDYKEFGFIEDTSIIVDTPNRGRKNRSIPVFDQITSIQSDGCANEIFARETQEIELPGSDILRTAVYFNNFDFIEADEFWADDSRKIPVYLLELATNYKIFYLSKIDQISMYETWEQLTKEALESLSSGKYMCAIAADREFINGNLIENYFILEK